MTKTGNKSYSWLVGGLIFAIFWASASTATKIGLTVAQPLVIAVTRFAMAAIIMLFVSHFIQNNRLPRGKEWLQISIYGILNISIYLGLYVVAMQKVTAGIGSLAVAINPVFISFFSVIFLNKKLTYSLFLALAICTLGVVCAAWPLFKNASVTTEGLIILFVSMLSYALAAIYFSAKRWGNLSLLTINGWQTCIGGLLLLPFVIFFYNDELNHFDLTFWSSVTWLAIPVSIVAVQLWLWLLKTNAVKAGLWLFLCPLFGFIIAAVLAKEAISLYTFIGVILVLGGLFIAKKTN
ncbi:EamA family transporter [Pedobacter sp. LMG 31464]|uniref:EamA family transporter n=1 Tax=Pedobacter planticolens TaxID=2679964 RepID=A0A923IW26_9SPHI|nr:EamA family transporter [Pedobacter planticolens]MBB2144702.1 EamA family transporter [Pedobacter planticolens]